MFESLERYSDVYGNCHVPYDWPENNQLRTWTDEQRALYHCGKLSDERIGRLENIGLFG